MSMKAKLVILLTLIFAVFASLAACGDKSAYVPSGELYIKTSPSNGDAGVQEVISLEAEYKSYAGDGDITVPMTVGFGHLPNAGDYGDDVEDTFYVLYKVIEDPWRSDKVPVWEMKAEYHSSFYDDKYDSTEQKATHSLLFARYGEFYPIYKEAVDIVFPASAESGTLQIELYTVIEGRADHQFARLTVRFSREGGKLIFDTRSGR